LIKRVLRAQHAPAGTAKCYTFFAHVTFALEGRAHAALQATANMLIVADAAVTKLARKRTLKVSELTDSQKIELAREIA
jgi:hypothetical protein